MEPAVRSPAAPPLPVAWLQGDVLADYLRFLELEEEEAAPAPRVPVAWLQGEVRDEFLRFLEESSASDAAAVTCPERHKEEEHASAPHGSDDVDGHDYESFVEDDDYGEENEGGFVDDDDIDDYGDGDADACVMEYRSEDGGVVFTMDTDEDDDPVLQLLMPHILDLPAFRMRTATAEVMQHQQRQQQPPLAFPRQDGGWMMSSDDDEMTDGEFARGPDGWMSSEVQLLLSRARDLLASSRARVAARGWCINNPHWRRSRGKRETG